MSGATFPVLSISRSSGDSSGSPRRRPIFQPPSLRRGPALPRHPPPLPPVGARPLLAHTPTLTHTISSLPADRGGRGRRPSRTPGRLGTVGHVPRTTLK